MAILSFPTKEPHLFLKNHLYSNCIKENNSAFGENSSGLQTLQFSLYFLPAIKLYSKREEFIINKCCQTVRESMGLERNGWILGGLFFPGILRGRSIIAHYNNSHSAAIIRVSWLHHFLKIPSRFANAISATYRSTPSAWVWRRRLPRSCRFSWRAWERATSRLAC